MKQGVLCLFTVMLACALTCPALAADEGTVIYPVEVKEDLSGERPRLIKTYILSAADDPALIPTGDVEREGCIYTLLDMTRQDQTQTDTRPHTETVTLDSKSKNMDDILPLLAPTREVVTEDGYAGVLTLDTSDVKVEVAGYGSSSRTVTATRSYPNLSDADTAFVPKTIEDGGRTLTLEDVQWQEAGGFYHATATYTGVATSSYVTGYTVTAEYSGEVSKTTSDEILYTAVFSGMPIQSLIPAEPMNTEQENPGWNWLYLIPAVVGIGGVGALAVLGGKKYKEKKEWSEYNKCESGE